jgi:hypothetical protein
MADTLRIKRRSAAGAAGAPATLAAAEIAYNEKDDILYYGKGDAGGVATSVIPIAGPGFASGSGGSSCTISDTPPASPKPGDFWFESDTATLFLFVDDGNSQQWVIATTVPPVAGPAGPVGPQGPQGLPSACTIADTPPSSPNAGDFWFESDLGVMWIWIVDVNSSQWVQFSGGGVPNIPDAASDGVIYGRRNAAWTPVVTTAYVDAGDNAANANANNRVSKFGDSMSGSLLPSVTGTINLGSASFRWATIYTSDLSLNNGIGDWTIVEGEDDLFLYNNKRGKVYKFMLYEVTPATAPPKKA